MSPKSRCRHAPYPPSLLLRLLAAVALASNIAVAAVESPDRKPGDTDAAPTAAVEQAIPLSSFERVPPPGKGNGLTVDDLLNLESLGQIFGGPFALADDGESFAVTRVRPRQADAGQNWTAVNRNSRADVWVIAGPDGHLENITHGRENGSGWFSTQWSPDGKKLAMLSTQGGKLGLWAWDKQTRTLRQISDFVPSLEDGTRPFRWLDDKHLAYVTSPESPAAQRHTVSIETWTRSMLTSAWRETAQGVTTASVLDAGIAKDETSPPSALVVVDVETGANRVVDKAATASWTASHDGATIALVREVGRAPQQGFDFKPRGNAVLAMVTSAGQPVALSGQVPGTILPDSIAWSPDANELAVLGTSAADTSQVALYVFRLRGAQAIGRRVADSMHIAMRGNVAWAGPKSWLVKLTNFSIASMQQISVETNWWYLRQSGGKPQRLFKDDPSAPAALYPAGKGAFLSLSGERLWRYDPATRKSHAITGADLKVSAVLWPSFSEALARPQGYEQIIVEADNGPRSAPYAVDLQTGSAREIPLMNSEEEIVAFSPSRQTAYRFRDDRTGMELSRVHLPTGKVESLYQANGFLREISEATFMPLTYASTSGQELKGWVLFPPTYKAGNKVPLLSFVYPGSMASSSPDPRFRVGSDMFLNLQLAAAHGYAVLIPSMPLGPEGTADDPLLRFKDSLMPAIDKVIELGVADPRRLFLLGHSYGGYAVYGFLTQTDRFAAAVAIAGPSDLISLYGQFDPMMRYSDDPGQDRHNQVLLESGQFRMGSSPWADSARYVRNSPLFAADRVNTPLMIVHGDADFVPISQAEEFYRALERQGKRVRFVRYWGEYHQIERAANLRDMWQRLFEWFDGAAGK